VKPNLGKIDEAVLALSFLTSLIEGKGELAVTRAWKSHDWEALNRLYEKGFIFDPKNKNQSVVLTKEEAQNAQELFGRLFCD
jgi:hypothetical protein